MNEKLAAILIAIGFTFVAYYIRKTRSQNFLDKVDKSPAFRDKLRENCNFFYKKMNIEESPDLFDLIMRIPENQRLNKYLLIKAYRMDDNQILYITTCTDNDFKVSKFGTRSDLVVVYKFNFLIKKNLKKSQYEFYSSDFGDLNQKNLIMDFKDELMKFLENGK
jgi:hypothetical protein